MNNESQLTKMKVTFSDLINADQAVLVDFSAEWCGPCKMLAPVLKELKTKLGDKIRIIKIDIDANEQVAQMYQVQAVPTLILFQKGEIKWRQSGLMTAMQLETKINLLVE